MPLRRNVSVGADRKIIAAILMTGSALASVAGASGAFAQTVVSSAMTADQSKSFSVPAGPLARALTSFGAQSGKQVSVETSVIQGLSSPGVTGRMSAQQALGQLLAGTGLTYRLSGNVVTLVKASANITLGPVRVGGSFNAHAAAIGPGNGYVATYTDAGTKTDTPLWEIPNSIHVITKQQILDQQPQNIEEALRYMPGVYGNVGGTSEAGGQTQNVTGSGTTTSILMRGFASSQFVDGIMSNSISAGETAFVERVEAINGPASVLYGQTSAGGLISTRLKQPTDTRIRNVTLGFGNWGRYQASFDVGDNITKSGNLQYRIAGIGVTQGTQTDYIRYERVGILPSIKWKIDDKTTLTLLGSYMYTPDEGTYWAGYPYAGTAVRLNGKYIPRSSNLGNPRSSSPSKEAAFEYQVSHKFNKNLEFQQNFRYENSTQTYNQTFGKSIDITNDTWNNNAWYSHAKHITAGLDTRIIGKLATGSIHHTLVAGIDFRHVTWDSTYSYDFSTYPIGIFNPSWDFSQPNYSLSGSNNVYSSISNGSHFQEGIYFQDQIKFGNLSVLLGGRQDWVSESSVFYSGYNYPKINYSQPMTKGKGESGSPSHFTWRAGLTYTFDFGLTPYFSYATSFVPQTYITNFAGQVLAPLTGKQFEAGLKYLIPHTDIFLTAAAYHIKENHYAASDDEHNGYERDWGKVVSKGMEFSAHANVTKNLHLTASYSYNDTRFASNGILGQSIDIYGNSKGYVPIKGKNVGQTPRNMTNLFVDYTPPTRIFKGIGFNFGVRYVGFTYPDSANSFKIPAFTLFDMGAHYDFSNLVPALKGLRAQLSISNLTNKRYLASCYLSSAAQCHYGQARRLYGNLSYSW
ncbi:TonB-dependent siderophore receptor [Acetobacter estunensis]|nr:TonB-dependent siderophore receptor [Acetobacter estunensis]MBV1837088.1 TonB-dependent siderophore receptor [Acetobacter estunensis]